MAHSFVALLRGINVGGKHRLPMADLRELVAAIGAERPRTYIQSGNLVFASARRAEQLAESLATAVEDRFGFAVPVIVRTAASWAKVLKANPFPEESEAEPNRVQLSLAQHAIAKSASPALSERARHGERVAVAAGAIWIHYPNGIAGSKLTPAVLDRCAASPVTARNWRTAMKVDEMLRAVGS